ncbi:MAG: hypothetical protein ACXW29_11010 [Thermoanaerobaculia bacterium]
MRRTSAAFAALFILLGARRRAVAPPSAVDDLERRTFQWKLSAYSRM